MDGILVKHDQNPSFDGCRSMVYVDNDCVGWVVFHKYLGYLARHRECGISQLAPEWFSTRMAGILWVLDQARPGLVKDIDEITESEIR